MDPNYVDQDRRTKARPIDTLKTRAEFQRVRGGGRASTPAFILEGKLRPAPSGGEKRVVDATSPRFGFTITKKIGNAVVRNRIRRRLRAALMELSGPKADPSTDYVLVARLPAAQLPFATLLADLATAFDRVHAARSKPLAKPKSRTSEKSTGRPLDNEGVTERLSPQSPRSATSTQQSKSSRD